MLMKSRKEQGGLYDSGMHVSSGPKLKGRSASRCTWLQHIWRVTNQFLHRLLKEIFFGGLYFLGKLFHCIISWALSGLRSLQCSKVVVGRT